MCGRYKISTKAPQIAAAFHAVVEDGYEPAARYNVAPTDLVPVIKAEDSQRKLLPMRWGLIPFWAKDPSIGARLINARLETVFEKPAFRESLERRRCLVVSDGFYEWLKGPKPKDKQPYLVCFEDRHVFAYAGLWARWKGPQGTIESCSIITTEPNAVAGRVHDRMPLIFDPATHAEAIDAWLDPAQSDVDLVSLRGPRELPGLVAFPVDKRVGNVKNDEPSLAEPLAAQPTGP
jgi:putative SOS response-associated peptidase YedK